MKANLITEDDIRYMKTALKLAEQAAAEEEVPVGAIVVMNNTIIARSYNQTERLKDCTAHAEMLAITSAMHSLGGKYLSGATLYVTLEPCLMCCGALYWTKIDRVVYGADDPKNGYMKQLDSRDRQKGFHPKTKVIAEVLPEESLKLMKDFFKSRRTN